MSEEREEYKFDHFKNIDEVMYYFNYWYKEEDVYSINRYLSLKDFNYISNKYQELQKENKELKKQLHDASIQIQELIEKDIWCPSNCDKLKELRKQYCERTDCSGRIGNSKKVEQLQQQCKKQKEVIDKAVNDIQEIIDAVNKNTIIAMKQFNFKLEIIQDELSGSNDILKEVE